MTSAAEARAGVLLALMLASPGCTPVQTAITVIRGEAMGTGYTIKYVPSSTEVSVAQAVEAELQRFDRVFSTYDPGSEISRFNRHLSTEPFSASAEFAELVRRALTLAESLDGAFDPTVGPLLRLYGFGPGGQRGGSAPDPAAVAAARADTGWRQLSVGADGTLAKAVPALELDLNAIAKGAGVDRIAGVLDSLGCSVYMVEIGGEVRCRGRKPDGKSWRFGVANPDPAAKTPYAEEIDLLDQAVATSGSYIQYREVDGARFHHIIDPRTGENPRSRVVSVSVIAENCELADGLATGLLVLGPAASRKALTRLNAKQVQVLFLETREGGGILQTWIGR